MIVVGVAVADPPVMLAGIVEGVVDHTLEAIQVLPCHVINNNAHLSILSTTILRSSAPKNTKISTLKHELHIKTTQLSELRQSIEHMMTKWKEYVKLSTKFNTQNDLLKQKVHQIANPHLIEQNTILLTKALSEPYIKQSKTDRQMIHSGGY